MAPVFLREWLGSRSFPREPEPALVMDDDEQTRAYDEAGRIDGVMAAAYVFHTAHISQVVAGSRRVVDLGCGPATQLLQVAQLNPGVRFTGVDLSDSMLATAQRNAEMAGVRNVEVQQGDITRLESIDDGSVDAVISTMALHHLPTFDHLRACFAEIARVLTPGGGLYVADFGRLKSLRSVLYFAYQNATHQPHLFSLDYERSLRAAFLPEDFRRAVDDFLPGRARLLTTFKVPLLLVLKSPPRPLSDDASTRIRQLRSRLPRKYRRDLDDMRLFFRLGGLDDPFASASSQ
jgi:ubiquinone/menaquinone biosynthesis C-methylase UbiE